MKQRMIQFTKDDSTGSVKKESTVFDRVMFDKEGFSSAGMAVALLLTISLIFSAAQVYQVNSASATIQNVADIAALAAENDVAEFYIIAKVCDAVILSLSLTGLAAIGLGIIALCIPATAALSKDLIKTGKDIIDARNKFAEKAASGLNKLQKLLPFISAAHAESIIRENSGGPMDASYTGIALLLPVEGKEITVGSMDAANDLVEDVESQEEAIRNAAEEAEEAAKKANAEKIRGFLADCGNNPGYCMYERAARLSTISSTENPLYHSVDTWDFSVALKRAQAYYPQRLAAESPTDNSIESRADSELRKRFYIFATEELSQGYVSESDSDGFSAYFPLLPKNTSEMKETSLYREQVYPITNGPAGSSMHAWNGCPTAAQQAAQGYGSLAQMDTEGFSICDSCQFSVSSFGKIAAASSSIESGFEYHYRIVAEAASAYQKAREQYEPHSSEVKTLVGDLYDQIESAFSQAISYRIDISPPGKFGAVALVVNLDSASTAQNFASRFVEDGHTLGAQVAISAATLVEDSSEEGATVLTSLLDGISDESEFIGFSLADGILSLWSSLLMTYTAGQEALEQGIGDMIDAIPLASESGLGTWAATAFSDLVAMLGLEPADLDAPKPALINTAHVLKADDSSFSQGLMSIKQSYLSLEGHGSGSVFSTAVSQLEALALESIDQFGDEIVIASIELLGEGGPSIPITIALPDAVKGAGKDLVGQAVAKLLALETSATGVRRWE